MSSATLASAPLLAFDLDGTLMRHAGAGVDYEDPAALRVGVVPIVEAVARVRALAAAGASVAYVTGRCEHVRAVTLEHIEAFGLPAGVLLMNARWEGYAAMARMKAGHLESLRAAMYVGDHAADAEAARLAGVPFVQAEEFWAGALDASPVHEQREADGRSIRPQAPTRPLTGGPTPITADGNPVVGA